MRRQRLSWDEEKVAEIAKTADPYTMNQDRKNPPVEKYRTGDPSTWAEDPHMATPWKNEGRTETGHPAPAREAVKSARMMEDKALKTITIAQRMLPGADDDMLEKQATLLMALPEEAVVATLQLQNDLAAKMASEESDKEAGDKKEEEVVEEAVEEKKEAGDKKEEEVDEEKKEAGDKKEEVMEEVVEEEKKKEADDKEAGDKKEEEVVEEAVEEKKKAGDKEEEMKEEEEEKKEASETDLLDKIFETPDTKTGAKKLSGIVKQASAGGNALDNLWETPPDVSKVFGR